MEMIIVAIRIHQIYPSGAGFTNQPIAYSGVVYSVAATNSSEAHALARDRVWASAKDLRGIVEIYRKGSGPPGDHQLWCGCQIFDGLGVNHNDRVPDIRAAMDAHLVKRHRS